MIMIMILIIICSVNVHGCNPCLHTLGGLPSIMVAMICDMICSGSGFDN